MEILKPGNLPDPYRYYGSCSHCKCEVKDSLPGAVPCPTEGCESMIALTFDSQSKSEGLKEIQDSLRKQ